MNLKETTVLFADIFGSTRLYQKQGDVVAHQAISQSLQSMKLAIEGNNGKLLRTVGDSALASFNLADEACDAAIAIQRAHKETDMSVRIGFHIGEVIPDAGDVYGNAVNLAARVAQFAEPNEICLSAAAVASLTHEHRSNVHYLDEISFKGVDKPMPLYRVHWQEDVGHTMVASVQQQREQRHGQQSLSLQYGDRRCVLSNPGEVLTFGRAIANDFVVEHESASRYHATLEMMDRRFLLSDASTNGIYIQRKGQEPEFFRREAINLTGVGVIGLGFQPQDAPALAIRYHLSKNN